MRIAATLVLWTTLSLCLPGSAAAEYDWYHEEEGASNSEIDEGESASHSADEAGWGLGLRAGYAMPFGNVAEEGPISDFIKGAIKPQLDFRYGLDAHLALGAYLALGGGLRPASLKRVCDIDGVDCRLFAIESGLFAEYLLLPRSFVDPWLAANVGIEWLSQSVRAERAEASVAFLGVGFGATAGADFELGGWAIGPFLGMQIGRFMRAKAKVTGVDFGDEGSLAVDGKIDSGQRAYHYWLNVGLRVRYP